MRLFFISFNLHCTSLMAKIHTFCDLPYGSLKLRISCGSCKNKQKRVLMLFYIVYQFVESVGKYTNTSEIAEYVNNQGKKKSDYKQLYLNFRS
jgi:hypothetical protein